MKKVVEALQSAGKIYKKINAIPPKALGIRNKIAIYRCVDNGGNFTAVIVVSQKSRLLMKDVEKFNAIYTKLTGYCDHQFKKRILIIDAPLCSKAKAGFQKAGWELLIDVVM